MQFVRVGVIHTPAQLPFEQRLLAVAEGLEQAIEALAPDLVAVERVFSQHNVRTVMATAQTAGLAVVAATRAGIPVVLHTPSEVKAAVTGSGAAGKAQVTTMVSRLLGLPEAPRPADAADALALAICAIWRGQAMALRQAAVARVASAAVASR